ncbi:hypothetical protein CO695_13690 [Providencia alcalifaciens]|uniref:Uncharacterized protein n=1 Tax=Providencia alcalifaciens DSM 30120 TaxID=520999 RepID=B6XEW4_9GAMM|nr:hypothetical protein [Providencia alcalifaciens]ATG17296.1 hypothetical protein CO695_13690 [Providencia alcalifaciens]EEB46052.1 hypothetical protein PROVALCAL_01895 [Providencia alcalifaciens DSM 30120]SQI37544.1 Uncharacterised protein [Providencia alcalifaciens]
MSDDSRKRIYGPVGGIITTPPKNEGLTLRDQFAMSAMQGILSNEAMIAVVIEESAAWVSREAYIMADAMLAARGKKP